MRNEHTMKLVILDRDGTLNLHRQDYVKGVDEWVPVQGSLEAIARLNHAGWHTVIATNQSGLGRGVLDMATLNAIHLRMNAALAEYGGRIDAVFFCPHGPDDGCDCRKPLPGLFVQIGERYGVDLRQVPAVGDSLRDLQAGAAAGCPTHLVLTGRGSEVDQEKLWAELPETRVHADFASFVDDLLEREHRARVDAGAPDTEYQEHR
jgi:D-glycero-D-manno-heptose 1,7-bisphosphate phosphatase